MLVIKYKYKYETNVLKKVKNIWQVSAFISESWLKTKCVKKLGMTDRPNVIKKAILGYAKFYLLIEYQMNHI